MVGFGSSLRIARRSGWEGAYIEYEVLKLLLSQIEAVYEEEGHRVNDERKRNHVRGEDEGDFKRVDYREELFLESDSDAAYESLEDDAENSRADRRDKLQQSVPFNLSHSVGNISSDEEDNDDLGCVSSSIANWAPSWESRRADHDISQQTAKQSSHLNEPDDFYSSGGSSGTTGAFYMTGPNEGFSAPAPYSSSVSILNAPVLRTGERTALLPPQTPSAATNSWYSFGPTSYPVTLTPPGAGQPTYEAVAGSNTTPNISKKSEKLMKERLKERRARRLRKKKLDAIRSEKEKKVPRHIRVAHSKARAITERFLGLLRAETEKVLLFAQARLGDLADTAGSLRFPSLDSETDAIKRPHESRGTSPYGYTLSDGGMHPSDSSSSKEGPDGMHPWSDWSDADENASRSGMPTSLKSEETLGHTNQSPKSRITPRNQSRRNVHTSKHESIGSQSKQATEAINSVKRQIEHFARLRNLRPVFQRNDQILGEDMLLISAVEEADGYTAVGVELMHVLRYICVNLIAVRKICRKHDRLLMNRMLGGYYHRLRKQGHGSGGIEDAQTLGGRLVRVSGEDFAHSALVSRMASRLSGVYDRKIQKLANSRTVQVVSSCLALALSEHEANRSRADKLTQLKSSKSLDTPQGTGKGHDWASGLDQPTLQSDDEMSDASSTASTISLTRLRFTVTSIFALREAARFKLNYFGAYLSRSLCTFTGQQTSGEGLDGCSRETLDFLVSYDPDAPLLFDTSVLYDGMKGGAWLKDPVGDVFLSSLSAATSPSRLPSLLSSTHLTTEENIVAHAVSIAPGPKHLFLKSLANGLRPKQLEVKKTAHISELPAPVLSLSRCACFLYMMNYYVAHSSTNTFTNAIGFHSALSSVIIGIPNVAAIVGSFCHVQVIASELALGRFPKESINVFRRLFIASSFMGVTGNAVHATGISKGSVTLVILGRFLLGFSFMEVLQRQISMSCLPAFVVDESTRLAFSRLSGVFVGLLVGAIIEILPRSVDVFGTGVLQASGWLMALLWAIYLVVVFALFWDGQQVKGPIKEKEDDEEMSNELLRHGVDYESDSSSAAQPQSPMITATNGISLSNPFHSNYGYGAEADLSQQSSSSADDSQRYAVATDVAPKRKFRQARTFFVRAGKILSYRLAISFSLALVMFSSYILEVFFSATPIITCRYFGWTGDQAGGLLCSLVLLVLPINWVCERIARRFEERIVIKRSLVIIGWSLFGMLNWVSLVSLAQRMPSLLAERSMEATTHPYDWRLGKYQFIIGLLASFVGLQSLQGAALSLVSKVSPPRHRPASNYVGTIGIFSVLLAKVIGDMHILFVELSHKLINIDIINVLVLPSILACIVAAYCVKRHFFFLM